MGGFTAWKHSPSYPMTFNRAEIIVINQQNAKRLTLHTLTPSVANYILRYNLTMISYIFLNISITFNTPGQQWHTQEIVTRFSFIIHRYSHTFRVWCHQNRAAFNLNLPFTLFFFNHVDSLYTFFTKFLIK